MEIGATGTYKRGEVEQLLLEGQKTKRKLQKVQQRRDHYARLYYQATLELDTTKLELSRARLEISELRAQVARHNSRKAGVGSNTTSPDSGASLSPGVDPLTRQPRVEQLGAGHPRAVDIEHTSEQLWTHTQELQEMPTQMLRAPTGCSAPPAFSQPQFRRSLSLSHHEPTFVPSLPAARTRFSALSQDYSFSEPRKFERAMSMPHRSHRSTQENSLLLPRSNVTADSAGTCHQRFSAFKQLSQQDQGPLSLPQTPEHTLSLEPSRLVCDMRELKLHSLSSTELLTVCSQLSSLGCSVIKLELSGCQLGQPHNMKLFCKHLAKNKSVEELSLPHNGIAGESLCLLLDCVQQCPGIKELLLRNNLIGHECAAKIREFLARATLDSLVLTGNSIEHHSHLLDGGLPSDFAMEYGPRRETGSVESEDSGLPPTDRSDNEPNSQHAFPVQSSFKYLRI